MKFTNAGIRALKPGGSRYELFDDKGNGFGIRVTERGTKTWFTGYRFEGRYRRLTHGRFPRVPLAQARRLHAEAMERLENGTDPALQKQAQKKQERGIPTFSELLEEYWDNEASSLKTGAEILRLLRKDAEPAWGRRRVSEITRRDAVFLIDGVAKRSNSTAEHLQGRLVRLFNFAAERGIIPNSPLIGLRRRTSSKPRDRALSDAEIRNFWMRTENLSGLEMSRTVADALRFLLLTGQRPGEVVAANWDEFTGSFWLIPAHRSKVEQAHKVPLTSTAEKLLSSRREAPRTQKYPFPSPRADGNTPLRTDALSKAMRRNWQLLGLAEPATPHDLRRTVRSALSMLGVDWIVAEKVLGHSIPGMMRVYDQHDYFDEKHDALKRWHRHMEELVRG